jgi:rSAM/selenodomain-associated transferase 1
MNVLLLFVKYPEPGSVKTRLGSTIGMERAAEVYREFAQSAFMIAAALTRNLTKVYVWFAPGGDPSAVRSWVGYQRFVYEEQQGDSLGDRMRHAFREAFGEGATNVVILGTDIPEITASIVDEAFAALQRHDVVLGPSTDGGYYLLGMRAPGCDLFEGVPWSTSEVLAITLRRLEQQRVSFALLPELSDIDTEEDYHRYLARQADVRDTVGE